MKYRRMRQPGGTWFFTVVTWRRRPVFADAHSVDILRQALREEIARRPFVIDAMVVLPDHLHTVWTLPEGDSDFPTRWRVVKRVVATRLPNAGAIGPQRRRQVWQPRYWEHLIRDDDDYARHVDYLHFNSVKHGLVDDARDWPWSSLHRWMADGWHGPHGRLISTVPGDP
jgi:putative transposase